MGLLIGYICVFLAKILSFTNIYIGVIGVVVITLLLMMLNKDVKFADARFWLRAVVVTFICLLITAPQLYFAWTVSVSEVQSALIEQNRRAAEARADQTVPPSVTITNKK